MRSFGVYKGGNSENAPFVVFASFCAQKEEYLAYPLESKTPAFVYFNGRKKSYTLFAQKEGIRMWYGALRQSPRRVRGRCE